MVFWIILLVCFYLLVGMFTCPMYLSKPLYRILYIIFWPVGLTISFLGFIFYWIFVDKE